MERAQQYRTRKILGEKGKPNSCQSFSEFYTEQLQNDNQIGFRQKGTARCVFI
jgi:hypothetical protein